MALAYEFPITSDLLTMTYLLCTVPDRRMRREFGMVLNDYRALAYIEQGMANTVTDLSRALDVAKCKTSGYVSGLCAKGFVCKERKVGSVVHLSTSQEGTRFFEEARAFLGDVFEGLLAPLDEGQRSLYDMGCTATATIADGFRLSEEVPDFVYIYLRACLLTELFITKSTQRHGLSLNEFRILFALLQADGVVTAATLSKMLLLPKATMSDCVRALDRRGLICFASLDKRSKGLRLTPVGRALAERSSRDVDKSYMQDVRSSQPFERSLYVDVAAKIVERAQKRLAEESSAPFRAGASLL